MSTASNRGFLLALAASALLAATAPARAADTQVSARAPDAGTMRLEWVGLELTPVSFVTSEPKIRESYKSIEPLQAGPGANIRLLRYRSEYAYVIPIMVGAYASSSLETILIHLMGEGGVVVPGTNGRLELGAGFGVGVLAITTAYSCDGNCFMGGAGLMASLAARYLFVNGPKFTAGVGVRAVIPLTQVEVVTFNNGGHSSVVMGGLEVGFGRP